jgi:hypothetical protein
MDQSGFLRITNLMAAMALAVESGPMSGKEDLALGSPRLVTAWDSNYPNFTMG